MVYCLFFRRKEVSILKKKSISVFELLAAAREVQGVNYMEGDSILSAQRFHEETTHMVEFKVLKEEKGLGKKESYQRRFLSETGYVSLQAAEQQEKIAIQRHAEVRAGILFYTSPDIQKGIPPGGDEKQQAGKERF